MGASWGALGAPRFPNISIYRLYIVGFLDYISTHRPYFDLSTIHFDSSTIFRLWFLQFEGLGRPAFWEGLFRCFGPRLAKTLRESLGRLVCALRGISVTCCRTGEGEAGASEYLKKHIITVFFATVAIQIPQKAYNYCAFSNCCYTNTSKSV